MLEAINLHKVYNDSAKELQVLKGVNFKIEEGKFAALVGPSGAGKSTLLHILGGLDCPSQGSVIFDGQELYKLGDQQLSRIRNSRIGFVFQFYHLLSEFSVLENVMMPGMMKKSEIENVKRAPPRHCEEREARRSNLKKRDCFG